MKESQKNPVNYRRRYVEVIQAVQWMPGANNIDVHFDEGVPPRAFIVTQRSQSRAYLEPGDYLILESDGVHWYPVKQKIFEATYELFLETKE